MADQFLSHLTKNAILRKNLKMNEKAGIAL